MKKASHHIRKLQFRVVLLVIPVSVVHPLSQQLNGRLSTVLLLSWHVEVVHKHHTPPPHGRAIHTLPAAVKLAHDDVLGLVGCGPRREVHSVGNIAIGRREEGKRKERERDEREEGEEGEQLHIL